MLDTTQQDPRPCPACGAARAARIAAYSPPGWDVCTCGDCGFVYLANPATYAALRDEFAWEKTYEAKARRGGSSPLSGLNRRLRRRLGHRSGGRAEKVWSRLFATGNILDIGCGEFLRPPAGATPFGIELSRELHARVDPRMRERGGYCLHAPGADGIWQFAPDFFDGIIMSSYLEHEVEVMKVLTGARRALKPGGRVFVRVPNFGSLNRRVMGARWCGFRYPDHVNYFTLASLRRVAANAGFTTEPMTPATLWLDDNIQALLVRI
jgi:SAM-dependent methyltransferase